MTSDDVDRLSSALKKFGSIITVVAPLFAIFWWAIGQNIKSTLTESQTAQRKEVQEQFNRSYQNRAQERKELNDTINDLRKQIADLKTDVKVIEAVHLKEKR